MSKNYWINTVSHDHVLAGVEGGFTQANHGRASNLKSISKDDFIVFYSPKTHLRNGAPLQKFTAIGQITDSEPYQVEMNPTFHPWRREVKFLECNHAEVRPLIDKLEFIKDKQRWGFPFRRGLFRIAKADFQLIADAMGIKPSVIE